MIVQNVKNKFLISLATVMTAGALTSCHRDDDKSENDKKPVKTEQIAMDVKDCNTVLFEQTRSKTKFALAFVENYYPYIFWDGKRWTTGHGLTILYNADGTSCAVNKSTKVPTLEESDVFKGRYLTREVVKDVQNCFTVPVDENTLLAACVLRYCIGGGNFRSSNFLKAVNAGKTGEELSKYLTGYRQQPGVLNRCYFFAALLAGKITFDDLLDLRAEGCYNLEIPEICKCKKNKDGSYKKIKVKIDGKTVERYDLYTDKDNYCDWIFDGIDKKLEKAKEPRTVSLNVGNGKYVKINCKLVKEVVADYVWSDVSMGKKSADSNTIVMLSQEEGRKMHNAAVDYANHGDTVEALARLDVLTRTTYNCASLENDISYFKYRIADYKGAVYAAKTALTLSGGATDSAASYYNMGVAYVALGKLNKAKNCLDKSLSLQTNPAGKMAVTKALQELQAKKSVRTRNRALAFAGGAVAVGGAIAIRRKYRNAYLPRNYRTR